MRTSEPSEGTRLTRQQKKLQEGKKEDLVLQTEQADVAINQESTVTSENPEGASMDSIIGSISDDSDSDDEHGFVQIKPKKRSMRKTKQNWFKFPILISPEDGNPTLFKSGVSALNNHLTAAFGPPVEVKRLHFGKRILMACTTNDQQNKALKKTDVGGVKVKVSIPNPPGAKSTKSTPKAIGVIKPIEIDDDLEYINEKLQENYGRARVLKRLTLKSGEKSRAILVEFPERELPQEVRLGSEIFTVELYKGRALQCKNCQKFGHPTTKCKAPARCGKCSENHKSIDCPRTERAEFKCSNCGGVGHAANYGGCKIRKAHNKATMTANTGKATYAEALNGHRKANPKQNLETVEVQKNQETPRSPNTDNPGPPAEQQQKTNPVICQKQVDITPQDDAVKGDTAVLVIGASRGPAGHGASLNSDVARHLNSGLSVETGAGPSDGGRRFPGPGPIPREILARHEYACTIMAWAVAQLQDMKIHGNAKAYNRFYEAFVTYIITLNSR
jgi:hypothetical protein